MEAFVSYHENCRDFYKGIQKDDFDMTLWRHCWRNQDENYILLVKLCMFFLYLLANWSYVKYFKIFKIDEIFRSRLTFMSELLAEVEYAMLLAKSIPDILSFDRRFSITSDGVMAISKFDLFFDMVT